MVKKAELDELAVHGFVWGPADRLDTAVPVARFQAAYFGDGLTPLVVDGRLGPKTRRAMADLPNLSPHFTVWELWDWRESICGTRRELVGALEVLRRACGFPLAISSGFRTPKTNQTVGGAQRSQHLYGLGADLKTHVDRLFVKKAHAFSGIGIGARGRVIHVDVRHVQPATNFTRGTVDWPTEWRY